MTIKRVVAFVVTATVMFAVGSYVYGFVVAPLIAKLRGAA